MNSSINLPSHLATNNYIDPKTIEAFPDWDSIFGFSGTLELEIGSGKGGFAADYGAKYTGRRLVTIEQRHIYSQMTRDRLVEQGVCNVIALQADAKLVVPKLFMESSLDALHVYFPDPWWKRRHFKRRVVETSFSKQMLGLLKPGGWMFVRTDVEDRAHDMLKVLTAAGFENAFPGFAEFDPEDVPTTREYRYLAASEPVWRLKLRRPAISG